MNSLLNNPNPAFGIVEIPILVFLLLLNVS